MAEAEQKGEEEIMKKAKEIKKENRNMNSMSKKIIFSLIALIALGVIATAQASLISYDLSKLDDNTVNSNQFNTTLTYPNSTGGFIVMDPSDNNGRMDRFLNCDFNATTFMLKGNAGKIYSKSSNVGFSGSDVLSSSVYTNAVIMWKNSGTYYYNPKDVIVWFGRLNGDQSGNQTAFNDIAYGFKLTDSGAAGASAGDTIKLVGIVYSTGTDSVFGRTADQLTSIIPEPATIGMLGLGTLITVMLRRLRN
jgi:hypothetical protein